MIAPEKTFASMWPLAGDHPGVVGLAPRVGSRERPRAKRASDEQNLAASSGIRRLWNTDQPFRHRGTPSASLWRQSEESSRAVAQQTARVRLPARPHAEISELQRL